MKDFDGIIQKIKALKSKSTFHPEAYAFLMEALQYTVSKLESPRHVSGKELLEGIKIYACKQYGKMAKSVLNHWKIFTTDDFGQIVFDLVDAEVLRKQPEDKAEDFHNVYNFDEAFLHIDQFADSP